MCSTYNVVPKLNLGLWASFPPPPKSIYCPKIVLKMAHKWDKKGKKPKTIMLSTKLISIPVYHTPEIFPASFPVCGSYVFGKDHHCVWLDTCVSASSRGPFLLCLTCLAATLFHLAAILLSSACRRSELYLK